MKVYRFVSLRFPDGLTREGAHRYGGRWNSKGVAVLYCALNESLAMLELRVHSAHPYPRTRWRFTIEVPDDALTAVSIEELPRGWDAVPAIAPGILTEAGLTRIIIPTVYRDDYISALKAMSINSLPTPLVRMPGRAARFSRWVNMTSKAWYPVRYPAGTPAVPGCLRTSILRH